jgi:hypothetical protein
MSKKFWPAPLAHIAKEDPWGEEDVVVAEVRHFGGEPRVGQRLMFSALVPMDKLEAVKKALSKLEHNVSTSGPHPSPYPGRIYAPKFWIDGGEEEFEPLVLSWSSHDKTVLVLDPGFLMTYGLAPRSAAGGVVYWDDPAGPVHGVAKVDAPSVWKFPEGTDTAVTVARDYLQDYLSLRGMALVQVFWEMRRGKIDEEIQRRLGDDEGVNIDLDDRRFQLGRDVQNGDYVYAQVWGARVVATAGRLPITENSLETEGLDWPGFDKAVTDAVAMGLGPTDFVYVSDRVLADYEGKPGYSISPKSGGVSFGTQWSVGFCRRVGRDLIRVELKKLYEGVPPRETRHWHKFAVPAPSAAKLPGLFEERNIAIRAEDVTYAVVGLGERLEELADAVGLQEMKAESFVGLRRAALDYSGWWTFETINPISRHARVDLTGDGFIDRCLHLDQVVREALKEAALRRLLVGLGVPQDDIAELQSMKLLDRLVCMAQVANKTGLSLVKNGAEIWRRLGKEGTEPKQPIVHMFALYDIRQLKAHAAQERYEELTEELERFGVGKGEEGAGYGKILDQVYDLLSKELTQAAKTIEAALQK